MDLSIVVLSFNTKSLLKDCLELIFKNKGRLTLEVIVVDNGSTDGSKEYLRNLELKQLKVIFNHQNFGFAGGNNQGIKRAKGRYILLLNSDTVVFAGTLPAMVKFMDDNSSVGVSTCRVELPSGKIDPACHRGFPTPWRALTYFSGLEKLFPSCRWFSSYHLSHLSLSTIHEIDSPSGCFYLVRKEALNGVGGLDENFFMYGEDLDWSYRFKQKGWRIMYYPLVKILHQKYASGLGKKETREKTILAFYQAMKLFYDKHYASKYPSFLRTIIFRGIEIKKCLSLRHNRFRFRR